MTQSLEDLEKKRQQVLKEAEGIRLHGNSNDLIQKGDELSKELKEEPD